MAGALELGRGLLRAVIVTPKAKEISRESSHSPVVVQDILDYFDGNEELTRKVLEMSSATGLGPHDIIKGAKDALDGLSRTSIAAAEAMRGFGDAMQGLVDAFKKNMEAQGYDFDLHEPPEPIPPGSIQEMRERFRRKT